MKLWEVKNRGKETGADTDFEMSERRILNFFDLTTLGVGSSLGVGVYVLLGDLTKNVAGPAVVVSVVVAGITALFAGLCFSEFGVQFLKADTIYSYSYTCNGESFAFVLGWALILEYVAGAASTTKGIIAFVNALSENKITEFLTGVAPLNPAYTSPYFDFISFSIIILLAFFTAFRIKNPPLLKKILTICNICLLLTIIIAGSTKADINNWYVEEPTKTGRSFAPFGFLSIIKGASIAFYSFIGFETIFISGIEIRKRQKNLPLGIVSALLIASGVYVGLGTILTLMCPYFEVNAYAALPFAFEQLELTAFKAVVTVGAFFGFQTSLFEALYPLSRIIYAMANDSLLLHFLGNNHPKLKTPVMASAVGGLLTAVGAGLFTLQQLVNLTVIVTLFVCTIIAVDVILSRYATEKEEEGKLSECDLNVPKKKTTFLKVVAQNYFNFTTKKPTNLTQKIIWGNIILFCLSSVSLGVIFSYFTESLLVLSIKSLLPALLVLCMILILTSMVSQPKSQKELPYKVPLVPLLPCLSIFLNIFLMTTLEVATWVRFLVWIALGKWNSFGEKVTVKIRKKGYKPQATLTKKTLVFGIVPHLIWFNLKRCKSQLGENSLYEINKMNMLKLNESIWKIRSEKKSFYEGAINPVFFEEPENSTVEAKVKENGKIKCKEEKASLQLKQAEIIQTADLVVEERTESLKSDVELEVISVNNESASGGIESLKKFPVDEGVHWECVAEIHTEEEILQESLVLEIFDNSYNFLRNAVEKDSKNQDSLPKSTDFESSSQKGVSQSVQGQIQENGQGLEEVAPLPPPLPNHLVVPEFRDEFKEDYQQRELLNQVQNQIEYTSKHVNNKEENFITLEALGKEDTITEDHQQTADDIQSQPQPALDKFQENSEEERVINLIVESIYETQKCEKITNTNGIIQNENSETKEEKKKQDDQNKIKDFKEKLNQLLKNQVNTDSSFTKTLFISKSMSKKDVNVMPSLKNQDSEDPLYKRAKTLNKSEIKNKLELLLSKGPPKRPSLSNSFNIKLKETDKKNDLKIITEKENIPNGTSL